MSHTEIARMLDRSPSTICREVERNRHVSGGAYRSEVAEQHAMARRRRCRREVKVPAMEQQRERQKLLQEWSRADSGVLQAYWVAHDQP